MTEYTIKVGNLYINKTDKEIVKVVWIFKEYYTFQVFLADNTYVLYSHEDKEEDSHEVTEFNTTEDMLIPLSTIVDSSDCFWTEDGRVSIRGKEEYLRNLNSPHPIKYCMHEWVVTEGFNSEYIDCSKCGAKKEEA